MTMFIMDNILSCLVNSVCVIFEWLFTLEIVLSFSIKVIVLHVILIFANSMLLSTDRK
jgi:hypothetical protein